MKEKILAAKESPRALEQLYRSDPGTFSRELRGALASDPGSLALQIWGERLLFDEPAASSSIHLRAREIWLTVALSLVAGTLVKLPSILSFPPDTFIMRNVCGIIAAALVAYFLIQRRPPARVGIVTSACLLGSLLFLNLLPDRPSSSTILLACLSAPFYFWSLVGLAFLGKGWRSGPERMGFVRYTGELLIYTTIILIGGMVLTGLTIALFSLIGLDVSSWYMANVGIYGAVAAPVVATLLIDRVIGERFKIAPVLARVFTPLFLVMVVCYLAAMAWMQKSPFTDRDFLIAFNGLLLVVLGLCVFSVCERGKHSSPGLVDGMNAALLFVTLVINVVALTAIVFRTATDGLTPNRLAVLGTNLLIFAHLAQILFHHVRFLAKIRGLEAIENGITSFLPAYAAWSLLVMVGFPLGFWLK